MIECIGVICSKTGYIRISPESKVKATPLASCRATAPGCCATRRATATQGLGGCTSRGEIWGSQIRIMKMPEKRPESR